MRTERTGGTLTDLIVHLYLQLVESEGGLVVIFLLDGVLWPRDHHAGPGVAVAAVRLLKYFCNVGENIICFITGDFL